MKQNKGYTTMTEINDNRKVFSYLSSIIWIRMAVMTQRPWQTRRSAPIPMVRKMRRFFTPKQKTATWKKPKTFTCF